MKTVKNIKNLSGKRVLVRCDFNIAVKNNKIVDDFKIIQSLPTIRYLAAKKAKVILLTHLGRPTGKRVVSCQLSVVRKSLSIFLDKKVNYIHDCIGKKAETAVKKMKNGQIILLENVRFYQEEEKNDKQFAKKLAGLADIYVNNAMAVSHRKHASVSAVQKFLPSYAGLLLEQEVINLNKILKPEKPLAVIIGGAKIETKIPLIKNLKKKADAIFIGGMISYDFLAARGLSAGKYKVEQKNKKLAKKLLSKKIILPVDFIVSDKADNSGKTQVVPADKIPQDCFQFDIGPETIRFYAKYIKQAKTIIWNGPMGMFEEKRFKQGTLAIARVVASVSGGQAFGAAGGGETAAALKQTKMIDSVDWVSTGGGAMLEYLAGNKLPGLVKII